MFNLQNFSFKGKEITVFVNKNTNEILFDASNVCDVLGYTRSASDVFSKLGGDEKRLANREVFDSTVSLGSPGAVKKWFINEFELYSELKSRKEVGRAFTRWLTHKVLPDICNYSPLLITETELCPYLTAAELGQELEGHICARAVHEKLAEAGLQVSYINYKGRLDWELTEPGKELGKYFDLGETHPNGNPVLQIKWLKKTITKIS